MTLQQQADSTAIELNQPFNHELKEAIKIDFRNLIATRLRQSIERNGIDLQYKVTYVDTLSLQPDNGDCLPQGCLVLRTANKIPLTIRYASDNTYLFVGKLDGTPITLGQYSEYKLRQKFKYSKNQPFIVIKNGYAYIYNETKLSHLRFDDIFEDGNRVATICDSNCVTDDTEMVVPQDVLYEIKLEIIKKYKALLVDNKTEIEPNIN